MNVKVAIMEVQIHETPLEKIRFDSTSIIVEFDDPEEKRWRIILEPYAGIKVTTIDCICILPFAIEGKRPKYH